MLNKQYGQLTGTERVGYVLYRALVPFVYCSMPMMAIQHTYLVFKASPCTQTQLNYFYLASIPDITCVMTLHARLYNFSKCNIEKLGVAWG